MIQQLCWMPTKPSAPCWLAYREAGAGPGSGHRLLLLVGRLTLDGLEVVERRGEVVHQPLPLELLLPLQQQQDTHIIEQRT